MPNLLQAEVTYSWLGLVTWALLRPFFPGTELKVNTYLLLDTMLCAVLWKSEQAALSLDSIHNMIKISSATRKVIALE